MKLVAAVLLVLCARGSIEAAALAKEGDQKRKFDLDGAVEAYQKAARIEPDNHRIHWKLATAYVTKEDWAKADSALANACALAPTYAMYFFMRGFALEHLSQWSDAIPLFEKAIALDPNYPDPEFDLAQVLLKLGDDRGALVHFTRAIQLQPDNAVFYAKLADLYVRLGYLDHADKTIAASEPFVSADDKHRFELLSLAGSIRAEKNDVPGALVKFEQAQNACGTCTEAGQFIAYYNLGMAQARAKKKHEATANLIRFMKVVCKGARAAAYVTECMATQDQIQAMSALP